MSDNKEGPVCSFCGAKKGQYSEIYKSNIGDQYICKECTEELARYSGVIEEALKRYQYLEAHNKNAGSEAPGKEPEAHAPNEKTWKDHLVTCAAMYAAIPLSYMAELKK